VKQEKKEELDAEKQDAKQAREAWKASPQGLSQKWLDGVTKDMNTLSTPKVRLEASDLAPGLKAEWQKVMVMHCEQLVKIRAQMEAVRGGEIPAAILFEKGKSCVDDFKKDQKDLSALLTLREKPARQPRSAPPARAPAPA
jgi:hypothetical protein